MSNLYTAWTNNKVVSDKRVKPFLDYLDKNRAYLISIGDFVFDSLSLSSKIVLSQCLKCEKYQQHNCCCGNSYSMPKENMEKLGSRVQDILKVIPNNSSLLDSYYKHGAFTRENSTTVRGHKDGYCMFSFVDEDGCPKCAIHKWCLENGENPAEYKPYICSLFPIEGIVMPNGKTVVFCSNRDTNKFSMYFYTLTRRVCVNEDSMVKACSGNIGGNSYLRSLNADNIKADNLISYMKPAYLEQEGILRFLCGDKIYDELVQRIK